MNSIEKQNVDRSLEIEISKFEDFDDTHHALRTFAFTCVEPLRSLISHPGVIEIFEDMQASLDLGFGWPEIQEQYRILFDVHQKGLDRQQIQGSTVHPRCQDWAEAAVLSVTNVDNADALKITLHSVMTALQSEAIERLPDGYAEDAKSLAQTKRTVYFLVMKDFVTRAQDITGKDRGLSLYPGQN